MSDELDDLFGAFDGADEEEEEPDAKKHRAEPPQDENTAIASAMVESNQEKTPNNNHASSGGSTTKTTTTTTAYASVMAQPIASQIRTDVLEGTISSAESSSRPSDEKLEREIGTGTSHDKSVRSYTAHPKNLPPGHVLPKVEPPSVRAKEYPFVLDPFQEQATGYIDKDESVLVAAHTSAGKTAVAEYAVATCLKKGQRVVYTSPIKALSNQKFRDLQEEFHDV